MSHATLLRETDAVPTVLASSNYMRSLLSETNSVHRTALHQVHLRPLPLQASAMLFAGPAL